MSAKNPLLEAVPYPIEQALKTLGANLRVARLRRNHSHAAVAERIGVSRRAVADAERGKASTGIAVYLALLWAYGLLERVADVADPAKDEEGLALSLAQVRSRGGRGGDMSNDF